MSKRQWAAIVYGRSYHLDFRFITIPDDFTEADSDWALEHILASTSQARNLANHPRWSLFKNDSHCVVGITCMVRDLAGHSSKYPKEAIAKDNQGRPLYTFVGYVTKLDGDRAIRNFPAYTEADLDCFGTLSREIVKVWWVKNYERDRAGPSKSHYQPLEFLELTVSDPLQLSRLNTYSKDPEQTYLFPSNNRHNNLLWRASLRSLQPTSTCLNIKGKPLINSPFLNQAIANLAEFQVQNRITTTVSTQLPLENKPQLQSRLSQKISHRAKEDLDLTLQQAAKVAIASQELINTFADWSKPIDNDPRPDIQTEEVESFGFKSKNSNSEDKDWF